MHVMRLLNRCANTVGYQLQDRTIVRKDVAEALAANKSLKHLRVQSVLEIEGLYRQFVLDDLPPSNEERTRLISELLGTSISEAMYILSRLRASLHLTGDVCEFGVAQGATSAFMANEIRDTDKRLWLFDSFQGLPKPSGKDCLKDDMADLGSIEAYEGTMACDATQVQERLRETKFPESRVTIVPGYIDTDVLSASSPDAVCFAYIDFDFYEPIKVALEFLDVALVPGGNIVVDDYDFFSTGAKTAVDEFVATRRQRYDFAMPVETAGHFCMLTRR